MTEHRGAEDASEGGERGGDELDAVVTAFAKAVDQHHVEQRFREAGSKEIHAELQRLKGAKDKIDTVIQDANRELQATRLAMRARLMELVQHGVVSVRRALPWFALASETGTDTSRERQQALWFEAEKLASLQPGDRVIREQPGFGLVAYEIVSPVIVRDAGYEFRAFSDSGGIITVQGRFNQLVRRNSDGVYEATQPMHVGPDQIATAVTRRIIEEPANTALWVLALARIGYDLDLLNVPLAQVLQAREAIMDQLADERNLSGSRIQQSVRAYFAWRELAGDSTATIVKALEHEIQQGLDLTRMPEGTVRASIRLKLTEIATYLKSRNETFSVEEVEERLIAAHENRMQRVRADEARSRSGDTSTG